MRVDCEWVWDHPLSALLSSCCHLFTPVINPHRVSCVHPHTLRIPHSRFHPSTRDLSNTIGAGPHTQHSAPSYPAGQHKVFIIIIQKPRISPTLLHQPPESRFCAIFGQTPWNLNGISVSDTPKIGERPYPRPFHPVEMTPIFAQNSQFFMPRHPQPSTHHRPHQSIWAPPYYPLTPSSPQAAIPNPLIYKILVVYNPDITPKYIPSR